MTGNYRRARYLIGRVDRDNDATSLLLCPRVAVNCGRVCTRVEQCGRGVERSLCRRRGRTDGRTMGRTVQRTSRRQNIQFIIEIIVIRACARTYVVVVTFVSLTVSAVPRDCVLPRLGLSTGAVCLVFFGRFVQPFSRFLSGSRYDEPPPLRIPPPPSPLPSSSSRRGRVTPRVIIFFVNLSAYEIISTTNSSHRAVVVA